MRKTTQRELREMVRLGLAINVTNATDLPTVHSKEMYSAGIYGINGGMYRDVDGNSYVIIARNSNLFRIF